LIALLISLPAYAQMAPPAASQTMQGGMPGRVTNPMMMPNSNPMMPNANPNMMPNTGGTMGRSTSGRMNSPADEAEMPDYLRRMPNPGEPATPSSGRRTTPSFVGMTRSQASALAQQYGLVPAFDGATSDDAHVVSQAPEAGVLIFRTAMPVRFEMRAPAPRPTSQTPAPIMPAQATPTAAPPPPTPAQATPTAAPAAPSATPTAAAARPAPPTSPPARSLMPPPPPPAAPPRNWWVLAAIAAGLAGTLWALFGRRRTQKPVAPSFNHPEAGSMARLATQIVGTGLAEATVSVAAATAPHFELRYVVEHGEQPDGMVTVGGGEDGG
jgi:hypothetical protein